MANYAPSPIMRYFSTEHLTKSELKTVSALFGGLAETIDKNLPNGAEKSTALRKLLEAKDSAVRSALDKI